MIITFSGLNGTGKTAVSKRVAKQLGYEWWGMGEVKRALAEEMGLTITEFDVLSHQQPQKYHRDFDERTTRLGERDGIVVDARAGWHFIPHSVKVFLTASDEARGVRVAASQRSAEQGFSDWQEALREIDARADLFRRSLLDIYGIDVYDPENFDYVLDTSGIDEDQVVVNVLSYLAQE